MNNEGTYVDNYGKSMDTEFGASIHPGSGPQNNDINDNKSQHSISTTNNTETNPPKSIVPSSPLSTASISISPVTVSGTTSTHITSAPVEELKRTGVVKEKIVDGNKELVVVPDNEEQEQEQDKNDENRKHVKESEIIAVEGEGDGEERYEESLTIDELILLETFQRYAYYLGKLAFMCGTLSAFILMLMIYYTVFAISAFSAVCSKIRNPFKEKLKS
jgi:hypothetical protein